MRKTNQIPTIIVQWPSVWMSITPPHKEKNPMESRGRTFKPPIHVKYEDLPERLKNKFKDGCPRCGADLEKLSFKESQAIRGMFEIKCWSCHTYIQRRFQFRLRGHGV